MLCSKSSRHIAIIAEAAALVLFFGAKGLMAFAPRSHLSAAPCHYLNHNGNKICHQTSTMGKKLMAKGKLVTDINDGMTDAFTEFLDYMERAKGITQMPLFRNASKADIARATVAMEEIEVEANDILFSQGDELEALYVVNEGSFEFFDPKTGDIIKVCDEPGAVIGELEFGLNQARRVESVRAAKPGKLWKLARDQYDASFARPSSSGLMPKEEFNLFAKNEMEGEYRQFATFVDNEAKLKAIKKCKLVRDLPEETEAYLVTSMIQKDCSPNEVIITQGDDADDVYVVRSGSFECYDENTKDIVKVYDVEGEFFGELGPVLGQKRALSIRVPANANDSSVWVINKDDFLQVINEGPLLKNAISLIKEKYLEDNIWTALSKLTPSELYNLAKSVSRPKKEPVSKHSLLGTLGTGFLLCALLPMFSPGFHENGLPQVFDINQFDNPLQARAIGLLFAISAVTGYLRIPPKTPKIRRLYFEQCALQTILPWMLQDSNVGIVSGAGYTFDLVGGTVGPIIFTAVFIASMIKICEFLEESIAGPMKGRESIPLASNRFWGALAATYAYLGLLQMAVPIWLDHNPNAYENIVAPGLQVYEGINQSMWFLTEVYLGYVMLVATLLFEKKLTQAQSGVLVVTLPFVTGFWDALAVLIVNQDEMPAQLTSMASYNGDVWAKYNVLEVFFAIWVTTVIRGLWRLYQESNNEENPKAVKG